MQVHEQYEKLRERKSAPAALVIGGMSEQRQIQAVRKGASVVVATPGRLEDYLRRKLVDLRQVTDTGSGRIRPHARHGLSAGDSPHCGERCRASVRPCASRRRWKLRWPTW